MGVFDDANHAKLSLLAQALFNHVQVASFKNFEGDNPIWEKYCA
jgi:hypothetical protein